MKKLSLILTLLVISSSAMAKNVWRDCGIGAMLFSDTGWAAVTSNIIWDLGTTATSSNVSSDDQCAGKSASVAKYIHQNIALIEENTASGSGVHLTSLLNIIECEESARTGIILDTRKGLRKLIQSGNYSNKTSVEKAEKYYNSFMNTINENYSASCKA